MVQYVVDNVEVNAADKWLERIYNITDLDIIVNWLVYYAMGRYPGRRHIVGGTYIIVCKNL